MRASTGAVEREGCTANADSRRSTTGSGDAPALPSKKVTRVRVHTALLLAAGTSACAPELVIGTWDCSGLAQGGAANLAPPATPTEPTAFPWSTGFEDGFCGFEATGGFCYANPDAAYEVVSAPVHGGARAAAFHIAGDPSQDGLQARCARQGMLPERAFYGAWFFVPTTVTASDNWNLFHFDGDTADVEHGLWDVSLRALPDGTLSVYVFDFLRMRTLSPEGVTVPVGSWFHLEVFLRRATDASGEFELYVDGQLALELNQLATDDGEIGQWYVGNLAASLSPNPGTLYVDDVTINAERQGGP